MSLMLNENEICPYQARCPHAMSCKGTERNRQTKFNCTFVNSLGEIDKNAYRNPLDQTGKQVILNE